MSLNKVLNRPMFRNKALKKGVLKTVNAQTGIMVGDPISSAPVPALRKPPTFFERMSVSTPARFAKSIFNIPFAGGYYGGEKVAQGLGIKDPLLQMPFGMTGGYLASKALPTLAAAPAGISAALMAGPAYLTIAGAKEKERIAKMSPEERAAHSAKSKQFGMSYLDDEMFNQQFTPKLDNIVKSNEDIKEEVKISKNAAPGSGLQGSRGGKKSVQTDRLTEQDNESDVVQGNVDINKVIQNNDPNKSPVTIGAEDTVAEKGFKEKPKTDTGTKVVTNEQANANTIKSETNQLDKKTPGEKKAADGTEINSEVIDLARKYRKELMAGQKSQAKLVFLANLASGLLSGTTTKGGLGGALEVFGKALGPAVNNYATVKLKENEMENEFMSDALELAQDELAAKNDLVEGTSGLDFESTGYIQFRDKNGKAVNRTGGLLKDGTYVMAALGQVDANGRQIYTPVPAGTFSKYFTSAFGEKEQGQTIRNLSGKYKALGIGKETIRILEEAAAKGETLGGPVGRFNLLTTRLGSALEDLGFSMFESKDAGMAKVNQMRESFKSELMGDGMSEKEADAFLDKNFGSVDSQFKKTLKDLGIFSDQTKGADLERLAINETVLTYALANSLKDKDRLTQKDIQMAKELVNVFPLLRGQKQVVRSLEAVNERILGDIEASELIYSEFGGDTATLENFRRKYGLLPGVEQEQIDVGFQNESTIDLLEKLGQI
jgi:hypothetical protein